MCCVHSRFTSPFKQVMWRKMCDFFFFLLLTVGNSLSTNIKGTSTQNTMHILKMNQNISDFHSAASGSAKQLYTPVLLLLLGLRCHINVSIIYIYKNTARPACYDNYDHLHSFLFSQYYKILIFSVAFLQKNHHPNVLPPSYQTAVFCS